MLLPIRIGISGFTLPIVLSVGASTFYSKNCFSHRKKIIAPKN